MHSLNRFLIAVVTLVLAGCATTPVPAPAEISIHHSTDMAPVAEAAADMAARFGAGRVLVAFDLDNTLLTAVHELGSDPWYDWQSALSKTDPCDPRLVVDRLAAQGALFQVGAMRPTEPGLPELLAQLATAGHPLMLITARGHDFRLPTFRELRRNGLSFLEAAPGPYRGLADPIMIQGAKRPVRYEDGVLMLAGQHKGRMLLALYQQLGLELPVAVVFADDKDYNITAMAEGLEQAGLSGELFQYDRELARVQAFDQGAAAAEWKRLEPALRTVEAVMGPMNYDLPEPARPAECAP